MRSLWRLALLAILVLCSLALLQLHRALPSRHLLRVTPGFYTGGDGTIAKVRQVSWPSTMLHHPPPPIPHPAMLTPPPSAQLSTPLLLPPPPLSAPLPSLKMHATGTPPQHIDSDTRTSTSSWLPPGAQWALRQVPPVNAPADATRGGIAAYLSGAWRTVPRHAPIDTPSYRKGSSSDSWRAEGTSSMQLARAPFCGSAEHADAAAAHVGVSRARAEAARREAPRMGDKGSTIDGALSPLLEAIDDGGASHMLGARAVPALGRLEGRLHALLPLRAVDAVTVYEGAAFNGRAHTIAMAGGVCRMPAVVGRAARSMRIDVADEGVRLLFDAASAPVPHTGGRAPHVDGQKGLTNISVSDREVAINVVTTATEGHADSTIARVLVDHAHGDVPRIATPWASERAQYASAVCLGAHVGGVVLYTNAAFTGSALVLWRARAALRPNATMAGNGAKASPAAAPAPPPIASTSDDDPAVAAERCVHLPARFRSLRVFSDAHALLLRHGLPPVAVRNSRPFVGNVALDQPSLLGAGRHRLEPTTLCTGREIRAVEMYAASRWEGTSESWIQPWAPGCTLRYGGDPGSPSRRVESTVRHVASVRLHRRSATVLLIGTAPSNSMTTAPPPPAMARRSAAVAQDTPYLTGFDQGVLRVAMGCSVRGVVLYRAVKYSGARLVLLADDDSRRARASSGAGHGGSGGSCGGGGVGADWIAQVPPKWHGTAIRSLTILHRCTAATAPPGTLCDYPPSPASQQRSPTANSSRAAPVSPLAAASDQPAAARAPGMPVPWPPEVTEFGIPERGVVLPFRSPAAPPHGFPTHLARGAHGDFFAYNPSLYVDEDGAVVLVARWSNYNFCTPKKNFEVRADEADPSSPQCDPSASQ